MNGIMFKLFVIKNKEAHLFWYKRTCLYQIYFLNSILVNFMKFYYF